MEVQTHDAIIPSKLRVKASFCLGSETSVVNAENKGTLSEQLVSMKDNSMSILKEYITKHNIPNDVPDELVEDGPEDDTEIPEKPLLRRRRQN